MYLVKVFLKFFEGVPAGYVSCKNAHFVLYDKQAQNAMHSVTRLKNAVELLRKYGSAK